MTVYSLYITALKCGDAFVSLKRLPLHDKERESVGEGQFKKNGVRRTGKN